MKQEQSVSENVDINISRLKQAVGGSFDVAERELMTPDKTRIVIFFVDGLVLKDTVQDNIVRPIAELSFRRRISEKTDADVLISYVLSACDVKKDCSFSSCVHKLLCGDTVIFIDGGSCALTVQTRGWKSRGIPEPKTQTAVRGPGEAFTETLLFNTALLRRKIKNPALRFEILKIGEDTSTDVCIAYVEGIADSGVLEHVRVRLNNADADYILESGHIEQLVEDNSRSLFPTVGNNEKPDIVAAKLLKGRVAIIVDGTPFVLTVPMLFVENFHASEDYYSRPYYSNLLRVLRFLAYITTLLLPALYIALVNFHQEMIPHKLLYTIMQAKDGIPFPSALEVLLMLILYEILREAVLRLPSPVGSAVGIVGGLIIGEAAVSAGIVGGPVVVVAAVTFITSAVVNPALDSIVLIRLILLVLASFMGIIGILIGVFLMFAHLCSLRSFGVPYMMPVSPVSKKDMKDAVIRIPFSRGKGGAV